MWRYETWCTTWGQTHAINCFYCTTHRANRPAGKSVFETYSSYTTVSSEENRAKPEQVRNIVKKDYRCFSFISKAGKNTLLEITVTTWAELLMSVWAAVRSWSAKEANRQTRDPTECTGLSAGILKYTSHIFTLLPFQKQSLSLLLVSLYHSKGLFALYTIQIYKCRRFNASGWNKKALILF